jgi:hypothetical protein
MFEKHVKLKLTSFHKFQSLASISSDIPSNIFASQERNHISGALHRHHEAFPHKTQLLLLLLLKAQKLGTKLAAEILQLLQSPHFIESLCQVLHQERLGINTCSRALPYFLGGSRMRRGIGPQEKFGIPGNCRLTKGLAVSREFGDRLAEMMGAAHNLK